VKLDVRLVAVAVLGILGTVAGARCSGARAGARAAAIAALEDTVATQRRQITRDSLQLEHLVRAAAVTVVPRTEAIAATDQATADLRAGLATARAARLRDSLDAAAAWAEVDRLTAVADRLMRAQSVERTRSADRIQALERVVVHVELTQPNLHAVIDRQARLARLALARRPWWKKVVGEACTIVLTGGGAALGAIGTPATAAIGGVGGYGVARLSCP
jgi:hypothetical protein